MFIAKSKTGEYISLFHQPHHQLIRLKENGPFFCPACDQELILKVGAKKIPHFAHKTLCPIKPEGESEIHLLGKKKLYTWLKRMGFQPEIERYLTNVNQQPDLLFSWQGRNCVIEFQCSIISPAEIMRRTKNYLENDYHPFWIIYDKNITSSANETIHFSEFLAQFLLKISETSSLILSFDPECDSLHAFYHIIPHSLNRAWATKYKLTKKEQLATLFSPPPLLNFSFTAWVNKTESWLYYLSLKPKARQNKFLQFLYQSYLHPLVLPPEVGIPLPNMYLIHSHPFEWQFYLWYHLLFQKELNEEIKRSQIKTMILHRLKHLILFRQLSRFTQKDYFQPIHNYIEFLIYLGLFDTRGDTLIVKKKPTLLKPNMNRNKERIAFFQKNKRIIYRFFS